MLGGFLPFRVFRVFRGSSPPFSLLKGRVAESPRGRARARHPRTPLSPLLPPPSSLLLTVAHCKVSTHCPLPSSPSSLLKGRTAESPRGRARARHPRTALSPLLPPPSSLLLTVAHCKVSTHCPLPSSPSSLLKGRTAESPRGRARARHPRTALSPLLPTPYLGIEKAASYCSFK